MQPSHCRSYLDIRCRPCPSHQRCCRRRWRGRGGVGGGVGLHQLAALLLSPVNIRPSCLVTSLVKFKDYLTGKVLCLEPLPSHPGSPGDPLGGAQEDVHRASVLVRGTNLQLEILDQGNISFFLAHFYVQLLCVVKAAYRKVLVSISIEVARPADSQPKLACDQTSIKNLDSQREIISSGLSLCLVAYPQEPGHESLERRWS